MGIKTFGLMAVDWEERVNFERLRTERLARVKKFLEASDLGALLCFDMNNIRYITATHIGTWAMDKLVRFSLLPRGDDPILWDFGSAARHHQLYNPWLGERSRAGISTLRGAYPERAKDVARKIRVELEARKLHRSPLGVDVIAIPVLEALRAEGLTVVEGSASPAQVAAYTRWREYLDTPIGLIKPGVSTADVVKVWPKAAECGVPNEEAAFALQYGHGVGLSIWEKPIFSRLVSIDYPEIIEEGMVFALETFWPASDGWSAARIEEQLVVTKSGCEVITRFPAEQLRVAGTRYQTAGGPLPVTRETQSNLNRAASSTLEAVVTSARQEGSRVRT